MSTPPPVAAGASRAAVAFIFITVVLDVLAHGVIIPVLPTLVEDLSGSGTARAAEFYGLFIAVWALMQFICSPISGALSDRFGRRPVILLSCLGLGLDYVLMALAPTLWWLFIGRVISGATASSFSSASAYIADVTPADKRAGAFGMIGAAFGLGFVLGPALGGILGDIDVRLPFWAAAALALANTMYGVFVLPESLPKEKRAPFSFRRANPVGALELLRSHPVLLGLAAVNVLYMLAHQVLPSVFVLYAGHRYGWGAMTVGLVLAAVGVASMIVQGGLVRPIVARIGERRALVIGLLAGACGMVAFGAAPTGAWFLVGVPVMAWWGLFGPSAQSLMTQRVSERAQGQLQGALTSLRGLTGLFGPMLFTQIFAYFIGDTTPVAVPGAAFYLAAVLLVAAVGVAVPVTAQRT